MYAYFPLTLWARQYCYLPHHSTVATCDKHNLFVTDVKIDAILPTWGNDTDESTI